MFTGIIESIATIESIHEDGSNVSYVMKSDITGELKVNQSVSHNGVCLTVETTNGSTYQVTAVAETLAKTNLGTWKAGDEVNIERALKMGDRLDGHVVQGHVDATGICVEKKILEGSWLYRFYFPEPFAPLVIEKGSVCINGVSLTAFNAGRDELTVTIIPHTYEHTNFHNIDKGAIVNIEFDVLGKYLLRNEALKNLP
jgi:riboflavin synthase